MEKFIQQIAQYLQDDFKDDIINLKDDQHRNRVRAFLTLKGYPIQLINKYIENLYNAAYGITPIEEE